MNEKMRNKKHGWGKTYIVYNTRLDLLGTHKGPKFFEWEDGQVWYWPHDIDCGVISLVLCDENFRTDYVYVGEL